MRKSLIEDWVPTVPVKLKSNRLWKKNEKRIYVEFSCRFTSRVSLRFENIVFSSETKNDPCETDKAWAF